MSKKETTSKGKYSTNESDTEASNKKKYSIRYACKPPLGECSKREFFSQRTLSNGDEFDFFGNYVASLLRELPQNTADEMQRKIICLILNTKNRPDVAQMDHFLKNKDRKYEF